MINRKIAMSAMSILTALSLTGATAFAAFTSQATSTGNTFSSGNANLQIAIDNTGVAGTFAATLTDAFNVTGVTPGYDAVHRFWLKNASLSAISLDMITDISGYVAPDPEDVALADNLLVSWRCDLNNNNSLGDETYTSEFSVKTWFDGGNTPLGSIAQGDEMYCEMRTRLLSSADSSVANGSVDFDVKYDATQTP
ncbi:MAG: hypothetical protein RLZZ455_151 [Candidatus Parcubacteria bacterium]|jgi:hypothetical protein